LHVLTEQNRANLIFFEVQRDAVYIMRKCEHLARHHLFEPVNARNPVADADYRTHFVDRDTLLVIRDLFAKYFADFVCFDIRHTRSVNSTQPPASPAFRSGDTATTRRKPYPRRVQPLRQAIPYRPHTSLRSSCPSFFQGIASNSFSERCSFPRQK